MPTRLSWRRAFFTDRRLTSKLKHIILRRYVKEFAYHLGSVQPTVYYVDGFAGPGEYKNSAGQIEKGSPLLIAELAREIERTHGKFRMKCLNVEADQRNYHDLGSATGPYRPEIVEGNYHGNFISVLPEILNRIGSSPAFFFVDPFGTRGIPFNALLPVFNRPNRTEALITFHTDGIAKKAGYFGSVDDPNPRTANLARKMTEPLASALNIQWENLRTWWEDTVQEGRGGTAAFEDRVLHHYLDSLRGRATRFQFTKAFPVFYYRPDEPPSTTTPICFYLVFATQHKKGLYEMNDAMAGALDAFYREEYGHTFFPLFREQIDKTKDMAAVQREILTRFKAQPFTIDQVKQCLMQEATLLIKASSYREAVVALHKGNRLSKLDAGHITNDKTRFACH